MAGTLMARERSTKTIDVITFGETMGLLYPEDSRGIGQAARLAQSFGGAESNVAIGLSRLGQTAGWFGRLGDDPIGHRIFKTLRGEGVDVSRVQFTPEAPTGLMLRESIRDRLSVYYYRRNSAASLYSPDDLDAGYLSRGRILHVTGITPALSSSCADAVLEAVRLAKQAGLKISFDPNHRQKLWSAEQARPIMLELARQADYFLPGHDELKLLYGTDHEDELLNELRKLSAVTVVKSAGMQNWLVLPETVVKVPFETVGRVVDPVGAGDAFTAGFLAGVLKDMPLEQAVRLGGIVGALTVQQQGDWEAIPAWGEVDRLLSGTVHIER